MAEETNTAAQDLLNEAGASGTKIFWGFINEEYNPDLSGNNGLKKYDEMRKSDAQIFATLLAMELPIRSTLWTVEPGETESEDGEKIITDEDYKIQNFIETALFDKMEISWDDFLRQALTMTAFWFSIFEKVFKIEDDKIYIKKLAQRLPWSIYKWQTADGQPGIMQTLPTQTPNGTSTPSIPAEKLLRFTFRQEGDNFAGVSVLRSAYKHWYIKDTLYKLDAVKHERQSVWIPVLKIPKGATQADKDEAALIMENLRSTEQTYVILPGEDWHFEFADLKAGSQSKMEESIAHHNREISKNILAQFLELGSWDGGGSYALSEDQSSLFLISLAAIAKQIAETINRDLIKQLVDLNFDLAPNQNYPKLKYNKLWEVDYTKISTALSTLAGAGILKPDDDLEGHVRNILDLPKKLEEENGEMEDETEMETEDETTEDTTEMQPTPEDMTPDDQDAEIAQMEQELADLEASELQFRTQNEIIRLSETNESLQFQDVSQETKDKISEALKEYWKNRGGKSTQDLKTAANASNDQISQARDSMGKARDDFNAATKPIKSDLETLRQLKAALPKGKKWTPERKAFDAKINEVRSKLKALQTSRQEKMGQLQTIRAEAFKNRVAANKEIKTRKQALKVAITKVKENLDAGKITAKTAVEGINGKIAANNTKVEQMRQQMAVLPKGKAGQSQREAIKALIAWVRLENKTYKSEATKIKTDWKGKKETTMAKVAEVKKQVAFKEAGFADEAEALAFQEAKNTFNIYDILKIQNYGNK